MLVRAQFTIQPDSLGCCTLDLVEDKGGYVEDIGRTVFKGYFQSRRAAEEALYKTGIKFVLDEDTGDLVAPRFPPNDRFSVYFMGSGFHRFGPHYELPRVRLPVEDGLYPHHPGVCGYVEFTRWRSTSLITYPVTVYTQSGTYLRPADVERVLVQIGNVGSYRCPKPVYLK